MEEERRKLMLAAREEFSEAGMSGSSLESISERAQLSPAIARTLFVDKEGLFRAVVEEWTDPLLSAIGVALEGVDDPKQLICRSLRLLDEWLLENPSYVRLLQWSTLEEAGTLSRMYQRSFFPSDFYESLDRHVSRGAVRTKDTMTVVLLLDSLVFFSHMMRGSLERMCPDEKPDEVFDRRFRAIIDLLEHGLFDS